LNARFCLFLSAGPLAAALLVAPGAPAEPPSTIPGAEAAIARAESALGSDRFGPYGCEAFVAYAYGVSQTRYGWDGAAETMYQTLLAQGQIHTDMNPPRGDLSSARGPTGPTLTLPAETEAISPVASKGSRQGTATGTTSRFCTAPMWAAAGCTAVGVWAIRHNTHAAPPGHDVVHHAWTGLGRERWAGHVSSGVVGAPTA